MDCTKSFVAQMSSVIKSPIYPIYCINKKFYSTAFNKEKESKHLFSSDGVYVTQKTGIDIKEIVVADLKKTYVILTDLLDDKKNCESPKGADPMGFQKPREKTTYGDTELF